MLPVSSFELIAPAASNEEAAAVVAALERFMRATASAHGTNDGEALDPWRRAALLEGVSREDPGDVSDPWINP
jgi:hypothetical protein